MRHLRRAPQGAGPVRREQPAGSAAQVVAQPVPTTGRGRWLLDACALCCISPPFPCSPYSFFSSHSSSSPVTLLLSPLSPLQVPFASAGHPLLLKWLCLCLGKLCQDMPEVRVDYLWANISMRVRQHLVWIEAVCEASVRCVGWYNCERGEKERLSSRPNDTFSMCLFPHPSPTLRDCRSP